MLNFKLTKLSYLVVVGGKAQLKLFWAREHAILDYSPDGTKLQSH